MSILGKHRSYLKTVIIKMMILKRIWVWSLNNIATTMSDNDSKKTWLHTFSGKLKD